MASRLNELAQKTNFTLLKSAKLSAWHKTTLITLDANQPTAFVLKLCVAGAVTLDLWDCITEENLLPNVTTNDPITDSQQPFVLIDDLRKLMFQIHCCWCCSRWQISPKRNLHHINTIVS